MNNEPKDIKKDESHTLYVDTHVCEFIKNYSSSDGGYYKCRCGNIKYTPPFRETN